MAGAWPEAAALVRLLPWARWAAVPWPRQARVGQDRSRRTRRGKRSVLRPRPATPALGALVLRSFPLAWLLPVRWAQSPRRAPYRLARANGSSEWRRAPA